MQNLAHEGPRHVEATLALNRSMKDAARGTRGSTSPYDTHRPPGRSPARDLSGQNKARAARLRARRVI